MVTVLIYQSKAEGIGEALIEHVITKYCIPNCIVMDQDSAFMSSLMNYLFNKIWYKDKNGYSIYLSIFTSQTQNKTLSTILTKDLTNLGQMWPRYSL